MCFLKSPEAKKLWKDFANLLTLVPCDEDRSVFRLVVENLNDDDDEYGNDPFEIVEGSFQFADPTDTPDPVGYDAAVKIQSKFRGGSDRKLVKDLAELKESHSPAAKKMRKKRKKQQRKSPEKLAQEKAELEMVEVYEAQAVISKHIKGHLARKEVKLIKEQRDEEFNQGAIALQKVVRRRNSLVVVEQKKEEKQVSKLSRGIRDLT